MSWHFRVTYVLALGNYGLGVNQFCTDDVSEATGREFSVREWASNKLVVGAREILLPLTG